MRRDRRGSPAEARLAVRAHRSPSNPRRPSTRKPGFRASWSSRTKPAPRASTDRRDAGRGGGRQPRSRRRSHAASALRRRDGGSACAPDADIGVAAMLLFAFLGGLILNLMPCVFPILAIKALALARLSGQERGGRAGARCLLHARRAGRLRRRSAASLLAFAAAGVVRRAGASSSSRRPSSPRWPGSVLVVGLNLSGVFEIGGASPARATASPRAAAMSAASSPACSRCWWRRPAPRPSWAPRSPQRSRRRPRRDPRGLPRDGPWPRRALCAARAARPASRALLPRPGAWMAILKQALAFPMYAAAAWLVWVISQQAGPDGVLATTGRHGAAGLRRLGLGVTQGAGRRPLHGRPPLRPPRVAPLVVLTASRPRRPRRRRAVAAMTDESRSPPSASRRCAPRAARSSST